MREKGFSLIEILVVVLILALVAIGILALLPSGYKQVTTAGRLSVLNHLGYEKIDTLKSLGYSHADLIAGDHPTAIGDRRLTDPDLKGYSIRWQVVPDEPRPNVKTVVVEAGYMIYEWNGAPKPPSSKQFQMKQEFVTYVTQ